MMLMVFHPGLTGMQVLPQPTDVFLQQKPFVCCSAAAAASPLAPWALTYITMQKNINH